MPEDTTVPEDENLDQEQDLNNVTDEPETEEVEEQVEEPEEVEDEQEEPEAEEPKPSRRETLRIQSLLEKYGNPAPQPQATVRNMPNYREMVDADDEIYGQLERGAQSYGQEQFNAGLAQANAIRWETMLHIDAPKIEAQYPQLDSKSDSFDPAVSDSVNQLYLKLVGYDARTGSVANPSLRYGEFAESFMELANAVGDQKADTSRKEITKRASKTGLRPDGSSAKRLNLNKDFSQMTDEELAAAGKQLGLSSQ